MNTRFFVDAQGKFIGGFGGVDVKAPVGGIEVPSPPVHAVDTWDGVKWVAGVRPPAPRDMVAEHDALAARVAELEG